VFKKYKWGERKEKRATSTSKLISSPPPWYPAWEIVLALESGRVGASVVNRFRLGNLLYNLPEEQNKKKVD
jgi:hypothetical protein